MKLMRYDGGCKVGEFIEGKTYFAHDILEYKGAESGTAFFITDENDVRHKLSYDGSFELLEQYYVCCVTDKLPTFELGEVLLAVGADDESYEIAGFGFYNRKGFEVLDSANVQTGNYVKDQDTGEWQSITKRKNGKIIFDGETEFRDMNDFRFAVVNGSVAAYQILYCIDASGAELTEGKEYFPKAERDQVVVINDDTGKEVEFAAGRFSSEKSEKAV